MWSSSVSTVLCFMYCVLCISVLYPMGQWAWNKIILSYLNPMTQIMVIDNNRFDHTDFMIDGERISEVEEFVYLGSKITKECSCRTEVRRRLAMAWTATLNMTSIWKSRGVSTKLTIATSDDFCHSIIRVCILGHDQSWPGQSGCFRNVGLSQSSEGVLDCHEN